MGLIETKTSKTKFCSMDDENKMYENKLPPNRSGQEYRHKNKKIKMGNMLWNNNLLSVMEKGWVI